MATQEETYSRFYLLSKCIIIILLVYSCFFILRDIQPRLDFGESVTPSKSGFLLDGKTSESNSTFDFVLKSEDKNWSLVIFSPTNFTFTINGHLIDGSEPSSAFPNYKQVSIGSYETSDGNFLVECSRIRNDDSTIRAFLVQNVLLSNLVNLSKTLRGVSFGMLLSLVMYTLVLFLNKRSERYLLHSSFYFLFLMAWIIVSDIEPLASLPRLFSNVTIFFNGCTFLLSIYIGCELLSLPLRHSIRTVLSSPFWISGICLFATLICYFLPFGSFIARALFALIALAFGIYALVKIRPENFALTTLFLFTQIARANSSLLVGLGFSDSLLYSALFTVPIFDLPYILGILLVTCKKFARKFSDAEQLTVQLDERVADKTRELQLREEQQHQLMLNVFHDLRSPLFVLNNAIRDMKGDRTKTEELLPVMEERSSFMLSLVTDLFLLAKLEIDQVLYAFDTVRLDEVVQNSILAAKLTANEHSVTLVCTGLPPCKVDGDKTRLAQVFDNLLSNAIDYAEPATAVKVSMTDEEEVSVTISNRGQGLAKDDLSKVFDQYYHKNRTATSKSTGLGLSIAKSIVEHHGGRITAESIPEVGTSFTVTLPKIQPPPPCSS